MTDVIDLGTITLEKEAGKLKDKLKDKAKEQAEDLFSGWFSKKEKYTENEDGSLTREIKVCKQKLSVSAVKREDGSYLLSQADMSKLDDKNLQKLTEKISKGKKLSNDEQLWVNFQDRTAVGLALKGMGFDDASATAHLPFAKEQLTEKNAIGAFYVNLNGFEGDKTALLEGIKQQMIAVYGAEVGEKHFDEFVKLSGLTDEMQKLADKEKAPVETVKDETVKNEPVKEENVVKSEIIKEDTVMTIDNREEIKQTMSADAGVNKVKEAAPQQLDVVKVSVKEDIKNDAKVAAVRDLLNRPGVKMDDKEGALNKLVENFGAEAAYQIAYKCVVEPANAMNAMGEGFKRSGASMEYFAAIDPNDSEKMAKVAEMIGVSVDEFKGKQPERKTLDIKGIDKESLHNALKLDVKTVADVKPEEIKLADPFEKQYADMCQKLNVDALKVKDLVAIGATKQDFDMAWKKMLSKENGTSENMQKYVRDGMGLDGESPVTKEFAKKVFSQLKDKELVMARNNGKVR
ncbi:MAG: hypothetical protein NC218_06560 [Acetobacter sp.]|nr:hypothetical protein [Acetobacter sp.]